MEFLFELLKEIARAVVREVSAYALKKQFEKKTTKNPRFTDQLNVLRLLVDTMFNIQHSIHFLVI
ncbi:MULTISPECIES: hypothetical protein [Bacillus cereus group]|nr:hypothetical protein [Bacillus wiedmannii]MCU5601467.1 hypothetical protein [Bacillus wiedmannii]